MTVTLIISTYNRVDALTLCLESVLRQTTLPNEIIIGDDGSKQETTDTIKHYPYSYPPHLAGGQGFQTCYGKKQVHRRR